MSKKRAFVRYTKSGEIVPGSLIITTNGGYPDKSSLWKEVTTNQCCNGGGGSACTLTTNVTSFTYPAAAISFVMVAASCDGGINEFNYENVFVDSIPEVNNINDLVQILNENLSFYGTFSVTGPTEISLALSSSLSFICTCESALNDIMIVTSL